MKIKKTAPPANASKRYHGNPLDYPCLPYLLAFFVPILVMLIVFAGKEIFPFGDKSFLRTDLYHQYAPFFQEYKDKLSSFDSLFYTWDIGLGNNFLALYSYYLSSPINWLLVLCPRAYVIEFITYGIVLRMALSSLTMTWYLNRHNETNSIGSAFFGIFYGLSGYMAAYSWNIMWLDCLFLFPMIILGLEQLVRKNKCMLYCISLAICIYSNYYISIMVCISLVLYFAIQLILYRGDDYNYPKKVLNFAIYSLLAGGLAAILLIPTITALSSTASGNFSFPKSASSYFTIFDMLSRHLMNTTVEIGLDHWPNIYCGVAILVFVPLYLMNKKVPFREKMVYGLLLLFFLLSFSLNILNFIWHGFHYPNSLPCRQSFIYIFLVLAMGYKGYRGLEDRSGKDVLKALCFAVGFVVLAEKLGENLTNDVPKDDYFYTWESFYLSLAFIAIYAGLTYVKTTTRKKWRGLLFVAALCAIIVETSVNMATTSVTTVSRPSYVKDDEAVRRFSAMVEEENDGDFFRTEKVSNRTKNDGAWLDYRSASIFSSTTYADLTAFYKKLGMESSTNAYGTEGWSWAANMLLGIKYSISSSEQTEDNFRKLVYSENYNPDVDQKDDIYFYENTYVLPLGFVVDSNVGVSWNSTDVNPGVNWNSLAHALGIEEDLFVLQTNVANNDTSTVTVTLDDTGYIYVYVNKSGPAEVKITYNDGTQFSKEYDYLGRSYFCSASDAPAGTVLTITNVDSNKSGQGINVSAYVLNEDVLAQMYEILNSEPLELESYSSTSIRGTVTSTNDGTMFLSIPYDKGWEVTVDGTRVETASYEEAFLSFDVPAGTHTIRMKYTPPGFNIGLMISLISLILLIMLRLLIRQWHLSKKQDALEEKRLHDMDDMESSAASYEDGDEIYEDDLDDDSYDHDDYEEDGYSDDDYPDDGYDEDEYRNDRHRNGTRSKTSKKAPARKPAPAAPERKVSNDSSTIDELVEEHMETRKTNASVPLSAYRKKHHADKP